MTDGRPTFGEQTVGEFTRQLASSAAVPGGGAASAISGAFAAALVRMVVALSVGKPKYAAYEGTLQRADAVADRAVTQLLALADEDAAAYSTLSSAFKLPRETPTEQETRQEAIRRGARDASLAPYRVLEQCLDVLVATEAISGRSNVNARSDASTAASLAEAAARGAAANVLINLPMTGDDEFTDDTSAGVLRMLQQVEDLAARAREATATDELRDAESG